MADYDLTPRIAPNLDRHLVFPLLEFLQERRFYPDEQILESKIQLLNNTNMVDYAMDIHKLLYHTEDVPQDMVERRAGVVAAGVSKWLDIYNGVLLLRVLLSWFPNIPWDR